MRQMRWTFSDRTEISSVKMEEIFAVGMACIYLEDGASEYLTVRVKE